MILDLICFVIVSLAIIYLGSRLQMRAWLKELDIHLGKKFVDFINTKKKENDNKEEK